MTPEGKKNDKRKSPDKGAERFKKFFREKDLHPRKAQEEKDDLKKDKSFKPKRQEPRQTELIRLNKYIANAGIASRRDADEIIKSGMILVNGKPVTEVGTKVRLKDKVTYKGKILNPEKEVFILLNKPKDYITTADDPQNRRTVMELLRGACRERIYPVGRLDRNTTGLLLFTNNGEVTKTLTHPKFNKKKIYHVFLDKKMAVTDLEKLQQGFELEDGFIKADAASYTGESNKEIGLEIHSGRNRIVRRMFEHLGYEVKGLDRVYYAGLTKKGIPRGKYRFLKREEINRLKMGAYE